MSAPTPPLCPYGNTFLEHQPETAQAMDIAIHFIGT
jgi:hypothetical protein